MQDVLICMTIFGSLVAFASMRHRAKLEEMRLLRGHGGSADVVSEIRQLQQQIHELRDTTTRYDMSFDAALQRLESRVAHMEAQQRETEAKLGIVTSSSGV
jgi:hypothetical protein